MVMVKDHLILIIELQIEAERELLELSKIAKDINLSFSFDDMDHESAFLTTV